jgi:hypothetical protein
MSLAEKLKHELKTVGVYTTFFGAWFLVLMMLKSLVLAEYQISVFSLSTALISALILAKVVLVLEHVPLAGWLRTQPAIVVVIQRTILYGIGVLVVLFIEKAFEVRHEQGGFVASLLNVLRHEDVPHVLANTLSTTGALLVFNALTVVKRHLGEYGLARMFLAPLPPVPEKSD